MWNNSSASSCLQTWVPQVVILTTSTSKFLLVLPPSVYILFLGFQQRNRQKPTTHSDFFTFHMISVQVAAAVAMILYFGGHFFRNHELFKFGYCTNAVTHVIEIEFHSLTCLDRYLAVVHPVTYLKLRKTNGIRLRSAAVAGSWLISLSYGMATHFQYPVFPVQFFTCFLSFFVAVIVFCCVAVLHILKKPGPSGKEKVDKSKRKAFKTICVIMGVLLFWLSGMLICIVLQYSELTQSAKCLVFVSVLLFNFPSQLVLPLLYLKREGKVPCFKRREIQFN